MCLRDMRSARSFKQIFLRTFYKCGHDSDILGSSPRFDHFTVIIMYVFEGYEIGAVRYLIKPVTETDLAKVLDICMEKLEMVRMRRG